MVRSPSASRCSPWRRVSVVPAGPRSVSRTQPLMFCPRSTTTAPSRRAGSPTTARSPRPGVPAGRSARTTATSTVADDGAAPSRASSYAGVVHGRVDAAGGPRAGPPIRSAASDVRGRRPPGAVRARRRSSTPRRRGPRAAAAAATSVPNWSAARGSPTWPRNQPSASSTATHVACPGGAGRVTSYDWHLARGGAYCV